jgi:flagellar FliL protein
MADEKKQDAQPEPKKPGLLDNKVVVLGGVVALQLVLAVVLTTVVILPQLGTSRAGAATEALEMGEPQELGVLMSLGEIIVTLSNEGRKDSYLRITVDLELHDQAMSDLAIERLPVLRDTVIMTLSDRSVADLNRPEGMKGLRDELMRRLAAKLPEGALRHIYFSDLVIQ